MTVSIVIPANTAFVASKAGNATCDRPRRSLLRDERTRDECGTKPALFFPVIDRNRCEGKGACVRVCPQSVFEVRTIEGEDYDALSFVGRVRSALHGHKSAYTPNASQCRACGLCVEACPDNAITLVTF